MRRYIGRIRFINNRTSGTRRTYILPVESVSANPIVDALIMFLVWADVGTETGF